MMLWHCVISIALVLLSATAPLAQDHAGPMSHGNADARKPLPLTTMMAEHQKANMREHLAAIQRIVGALAHDDMAAVAQATSTIGFSESMGQMCEHMGAAAPGFTPMALNFHRTADTIAVAARAGDRSAVLTALDRTLQTCVGCHASYRQEVVDAETWQRLTSGAAPAHGATAHP